MSSTAPKKDTAVSAEKPEASVVSEKTKNIVDASEEDDDEEPEPTTDIYVRLYNDDDKDYCFVVKLTGKSFDFEVWYSFFLFSFFFAL